MFVIKINWKKGTIVTADVNVAANEFEVEGFKCLSTSGETPEKLGWFRLKDFTPNADPDFIAKVQAAFSTGTELKELKFDKLLDAERKMFMVVKA